MTTTTTASAAIDVVLGLAVALGAGLLIGLERERRKGSGPDREAAGIRSFTLAALGGAMAQALGQPLLVGVGALAVAALASVAYFRSRARDAAGDPGLTTELALIVTYLIGVMAIGAPGLAAGSAAAVAALLAARGRLHRFATQVLSEAELHDALLLAALALVILPLVPQQALPWLGGLKPYTLMALVLVILLLQAAGHVALRLWGPRAGLLLSGLFSGFVSSTATIASMGARARADAAQRRAAQGGAVMSSVPTWVQSVVMLLPLAPAVALALLPVAAGGAVVALSWALWRVRALPRHDAAAPPVSSQRALRVREALLVTTLLAAVTALVTWAQGRFGTTGVLIGSALSALADAHASIAALGALVGDGRLDVPTALLGALAAIGSNSGVRMVVAWIAGGADYARAVAAALALSYVAALAVAWLVLGG